MMEMYEEERKINSISYKLLVLNAKPTVKHRRVLHRISRVI